MILSALIVGGCSETVTGVAKPRDLPAPATGEFAGITGQWVGSYTCAQGDTGLNLVVEADGRTEFHFFPLPRNAAAASGSFEMQAAGTASGLFEFRQTQWIDQPGGYFMVDLVTTDRTDMTLRGNVIGTGCTTFEVSRDRT